jgi:hypothetical protein
MMPTSVIGHAPETKRVSACRQSNPPDSLSVATTAALHNPSTPLAVISWRWPPRTKSGHAAAATEMIAFPAKRQ